MLALKFGGTSMGTAESMLQSAEIVESIVEPKAVVVSATSGTTDTLIKLGKTAFDGGEWEDIWREIVERHENMVKELGVEVELAGFWDELRKIAQGISMIKELSPSTLDRMMTFGERISCQILAGLLVKRGGSAVAMDAYNFVFTDNNFGEGNVDFDRTNEAVAREVGGVIASGAVPVITGFVGQAENGAYITLGRGGSDYSCAIVGAALGASEVQIWTDVDGILNADPRLISEASVLEQLSFNEAAELAYFGAKVLHPKTIKPAIKKDIPVKILNTFNPSAPGTVITNHEEVSLKSVTYKKGVAVINVCSAGMLEARGFMARLFEVFRKHEVGVDVVSTSEVSVSMTVDDHVSDELIRDLSEFAEVGVQHNMAIVCLVGEGIRAKTSVLGDVFTAISEYDVSMVSQGSSKRNITFVVEEVVVQEVVKKVFGKFFAKN